MTDLARIPAHLPAYARDADRPYVDDPWLKQPGETARSYEAFKMYLALDPESRTQAAVNRQYAEKYGTSPDAKKCGQWYKRHRWGERAEAYDNFMSAKIIAANRRRAIARSVKHADQAADMLEISMLPTKELRKRLEEQGGQLAAIANLDDVSLLKLQKALGSDVPTLQKAERDALSSTSDVAPPNAGTLKAKGELVRKMLANPSLRLLAERMTFEVEVTDADATELPDVSDG